MKTILNDRETMEALIPFFKRTEWTDDQVRDRYENFLRGQVVGHCVPWAIHALKEGIVVGDCGFKKIDRVRHEAEFGIILSKYCWGKGHALECHLLGLDFGFNKLSLNRVYFNTNETNQRMQRFFDKSGVRFFQKTPEGYLQYEILKDEWSHIQIGLLGKLKSLSP